MEGRNDIQDWLALIALPGLGCVLARRLLAAFGTPGKVLKAGKAVAEVPGIGRNLVELFLAHPGWTRPASGLNRNAFAFMHKAFSCSAVMTPFIPLFSLISTITLFFSIA